MATYKCNDPIYTVLRNGKIISNNVKPGTAITNIIADAENVVCPPECCMSDVSVALDTFDLEVTTVAPTGFYIRATITHNEDTYSTAWQTCTGTDTIDLVGIIIEVGGWFDGDTLCVEYSYDQTNVIAGCCADIVVTDYVDEDTYQLSEIVPECDTSLFELLYQNPDGGVTVSPDGEMVIPDLSESETVFISRKCDGCLTELLVLTANADLLGLRLTYTPGNLPANDLAAWNTFFDLPANGTAFTSMATAGDEVTLYGGAGITLKQSLFRTSATLLKIEDDVDCVVAVGGGRNLGALSLCSALTTVTLNGVTTVEQEGLYANAALTSLSMTALTTVGASAFDGCATLSAISLPTLATAGAACFANCTSATTFTLPQLTSADANCFANCTSATTFTLPLLTSAGNNCFNGCTAATTFTLPELLTAGNLCFSDCTSNVIFNIPKLASADTQCFNGCTSATTFTLPLLTSAGNNCFNGCTAATTFDLSACTALGTTTGDNSVFSGITGNTITITVPTALSTCDGGNPDGDLVWLDAQNPATFNFI